jgi:hypothetical protein
VALDGLDDGVGAAAAELARGLGVLDWVYYRRVAGAVDGRWETYGGADLHVVFADRGAVVHGVEGSDLVNAHRRHLKKTRNLVHDAKAGESVLALTEVEDGHHGGLLVLGRVAGQDLLDHGVVLLAEFERDARIVVGGVAVLGGVSADVRGGDWGGGGRRAAYHEEGITGYPGGGDECPTLGANGWARCDAYPPCGRAEDVGSDLGGHWSCRGSQWLV